MEEVKIYRSRVISFLFLAFGGVMFLFSGLLVYGILSYSSDNYRVLWFAVLASALGGLMICSSAIKGILSNKPYLTINDECLIINKGWTTHVIRFANVDSFTTTFPGLMFWHKYVRPKYKFIPMNLVLWQSSLISARGTGMKTRELRDMLNERLKNSRSKSSESLSLQQKNLKTRLKFPVLNETKIYHTPRRMLLLMAGHIGFVALGIGFIYSYQFTEYAYYQWVAYACIIFFGCASLTILTSAIKEFVFHRPYIIITDEHIIIQKWTPKTINLADVKTFKIAQSIFGGTPTENQEFVAVIYTPEAEQRIKLESGAFGNALRAVNSCLTTQKGTFDYITTQGTTLSAQELCDMLNERLRNYRAKKATP